jgi:hypothetical protein
MPVETLPSFQRSPESPALAGSDSRIAIVIPPVARGEPFVVHGAYRLASTDRALVSGVPVKRAVWLLAIDRVTRQTWAGRPGAEVILFPGDEPEDGPIEGWFSVHLAECCAIDVTAVLGPITSEVVELELPDLPEAPDDEDEAEEE